MVHLKTHIPERFIPMPEIPFCVYRKYRPEYIEVETLLNLSRYVHNSNCESAHWHYTPEEVANWILQDSGHPEYKEAFIKNEIDGKAVIFLEADRFPKVGIRNFDVIKELTEKIRNLCGTDKDEFSRSISLPIRRPRTLYLWYKTKHSGPTAYYMSPTKYFRVIHIIPEEEACGRSYYELLNHWNRIPPYMPWCPHIMIGGSRRINPMTGTTQRQSFPLQDHPYLLNEFALCMNHLPPNFQFPVGRKVEATVPFNNESDMEVKCD